jgi:DNA-binding transcriptional MerR regulator
VRIGELSERTAVSARMLRHYEQLGLLRPERSANGYREYTEADVDLVTNLRCLADLGLDLRTAGSLARMECGLAAPRDSQERASVLAIVDAQLAVVVERRRELDQVAAQLASLRRELETPPAGEGPDGHDLAGTVRA